MINYQRVVRVFEGELMSLIPKRAKSSGQPSRGMILKLRVNGEVITLEDTVSKVIDDLAEQAEDND
jgi:hypothetical protein